MVLFRQILALTIPLARLCRAFDASSRTCPEYTRLCLTSFIWCDREGQSQNHNDCSWPENVYPTIPKDYAGPPAIILRGAVYNVSWTGANQNYPVQLTWDLPCITDGGNCVNESRIFWQYNTSVPPPSSVTFPPSLDNFTYMNGSEASREAVLARFATGVLMQLDIAQPDVLGQDGRPLGYDSRLTYPYFDNSDSFLVGNYFTGEAIESAEARLRRRHQRAVRLGAGIGVGLGVPLLIAVSVLSTWIVIKKKS